MSTSTESRVAGLDLSITDATGQRRRRLSGVKPDETAGELLRRVLSRMNLPENDVNGYPVGYRLHLERESRNLSSSERVGDSLKPEDELVVVHDVIAG